MRFTKVDEVPKRGAYHDLKDDLDRFMKSGLKIAKIDFHQDEYKSATIAANCLRVAIKRHGFNGIKVILRGALSNQGLLILVYILVYFYTSAYIV